MSLETYLALALVLTVAFVFILRSWRRGIYFIFSWLLLEDIVRRLLPGQPVEIQLVKETLVFETYFAFFVSWRSQGRLFWSPPFSTSLLMFSAIVLLDAFNPRIQSFLIPFTGIRSYLWYIPLVWIGYHGFKTRVQLVRFTRFILQTSVPLALLAVIQYLFWERLPTWLQPLEGAHSVRVVAYEFQGEVIGFQSKLPSSVFGSAHRFAMFSLFLFFLGIGLRGFTTAGSRQRRRLSLGVFILSSLVCVVVAGTRMGMLLALVGVFLLAIEPVLTRQKGLLMKRVRVRQLLAGLILGAVFFGILEVFSDTGRFFLHTTESGVEEHWKGFTEGQLPNVAKKASWMGLGTGVLSQGLSYVPGGEEAFRYASRESEGTGIEYGLAKVTWELGWFGLALFLALWFRVFWTVGKSLRAIRDPSIRGLACALGTFVLLIFVAFLKGHYYLGDGTTLVAYWFSLGMLFALVRLDRKETAQWIKARAFEAGSARPTAR